MACFWRRVRVGPWCCQAAPAPIAARRALRQSLTSDGAITRGQGRVNRRGRATPLRSGGLSVYRADVGASEKVRAAAVVALVTLAVGTALTVAFSVSRAGEPSFYAWSVGPYLAVAATAALIASKRGELGAWLRPGWGDVTRGFLGAAILFVAAFAFVKLAVPSGSPRERYLADIYLQLGDTKHFREHMALVAVGLVVAAAAEELVWRGWVQRECETLVGRRRAWILAAVLYALAHAGTGYALETTQGYNPMMLIAAAGAGVVWGAMRKSFGRLFPGILAHAAFDWAVVMMYRLYGPSV